MYSRIGSGKVHGLASSTEALRTPSASRAWKVLRSPITRLLCVFALATAVMAQDVPPEVNAPIVRSTRPRPAPAISPTAPLATQPSSVVRLSPGGNPGAQPPIASTAPAHHRHATSLSVQPTPPPAVPDQPTSLLQLPASRAQVRVSTSGIAIQANNASLSQVLHDISSATGMKVEGLGHDERVFGNYGPGTPRDVLSTLLDGAGYNVLMLGEIADGAPRQLILTQRDGATAPPTAEVTKPPAEDEPEPDPEEQEMEAPASSRQPMAPGMPNPNTNPGSEVRTPQQLLEQLQRIHQDPTQPPQSPPE